MVNRAHFFLSFSHQSSLMNHINIRHSILFITIASVGHSASALAATLQIVDLGTLGGTTSFALDVNNHRQVTGNAQEPVSEPAPRLNAFLWETPGPMSNLGMLPGSNNFSRGYALNDAGVVVGESDNNNSRAFVYSNGALAGLTRLAGDNDRGVAHDINNAGEIVGISSNGTVSRATKWIYNGSSYVPSDLGTIAGTATATGRGWAINQNGTVVGFSTNAAGTSQATLWHEGAITNLTSLGDGARFSQAFGVNDNNIAVGSSSTGQTVGELIGSSSTTAITRAFQWELGVMAELSPFNVYTAANNGSDTNYHSVANDVNRAGLIVGNSQRVAGSPAVATLWQNGIAIDLNTLIASNSGWVLRSAEGINDRGDIAGYGTLDGQTRAFLLTAVPEPSAFGLLFIGLVAWAGAYRQRNG
jgi:probable HAF family extracellular repeat protein